MSVETGNYRCSCGGELATTQPEPGDLRTLRCQQCSSRVHEIAGTPDRQPPAAVAGGSR